MMVQDYTRALRKYDRDLFAGQTMDGALCVFRKVKQYELVCDDPRIFNLKESAQFVFALTDNWGRSGKPRAWGIDNVVGRVREIDTLANKRFFDELDEKNEKVDETQKKDFRNDAEAFFADNRKEFVKEFDKLGCIHSLSKDEPRKRLKDRSIKNGNY